MNAFVLYDDESMNHPVIKLNQIIAYLFGFYCFIDISTIYLSWSSMFEYYICRGWGVAVAFLTDFAISMFTIHIQILCPRQKPKKKKHK